MMLTNEWKDPHFEVFYGTRPCMGELKNGDAVLLMRNAQTLSVGIIDGLGHGSKAAEIASTIKQYVENLPPAPPDIYLLQSHLTFKGSHGACMGIAQIDETGNVTFSGLGNIACKVVSDQQIIPLLSKDGVIGIRSRTLDATKWKMNPNDLLVLFSDGMSERADCTSLLRLALSQQSIAKCIHEFGKKHDDVSFLVLRFLGG